MDGKRHPLTRELLEVEVLEAPAGTAILMWTHAAHAVNARKLDSPVYGYRNPGAKSAAHRITEKFERNPLPDTEKLLSFY